MSKSMTKGQLIQEVGDQINNKQNAKVAVNFILSRITDLLVNKKTLTLVGFGTFKTVERESRKCRNPKTGEIINVNAKTVPKFVPGKNLKEAVEQG